MCSIVWSRHCSGLPSFQAWSCWASGKAATICMLKRREILKLAFCTCRVVCPKQKLLLAGVEQSYTKILDEGTHVSMREDLGLPKPALQPAPCQAASVPGATVDPMPFSKQDYRGDPRIGVADLFNQIF